MLYQASTRAHHINYRPGQVIRTKISRRYRNASTNRIWQVQYHIITDTDKLSYYAKEERERGEEREKCHSGPEHAHRISANLSNIKQSGTIYIYIIKYKQIKIVIIISKS